MQAGQIGCNAGWEHALKVKVEADNQKCYDQGDEVKIIITNRCIEINKKG